MLSSMCAWMLWNLERGESPDFFRGITQAIASICEYQEKQVPDKYWQLYPDLAWPIQNLTLRKDIGHGYFGIECWI